MPWSHLIIFLHFSVDGQFEKIIILLMFSPNYGNLFAKFRLWNINIDVHSMNTKSFGNWFGKFDFSSFHKWFDHGLSLAYLINLSFYGWVKSLPICYADYQQVFVHSFNVRIVHLFKRNFFSLLLFDTIYIYKIYKLCMKAKWKKKSPIWPTTIMLFNRFIIFSSWKRIYVVRILLCYTTRSFRSMRKFYYKNQNQLFTFEKKYQERFERFPLKLFCVKRERKKNTK